MVSVELEHVQKHIGNLIAVGRNDDANREYLAFLDRYAREGDGQAASTSDLIHVSYFLAYKLLPDLIHRRWDEFLERWSAPFPFQTYLAMEGAAMMQKWLNLDQIKQFSGEAGKLNNSVCYYLIQFPTPPEWAGDNALDQVAAAFGPGKKPSFSQVPVLGPYFLAALQIAGSAERVLYVLGQSTIGGTTLRSVTAGGINGNCGPGPDPTISNFLKTLRQRIKR